MRRRAKRREELVAEYLASDMSYREMGERYGVSPSTLQRWVVAAGRGAARAGGAGAAAAAKAVAAAAGGGAAAGGEAGERRDGERAAREGKMSAETAGSSLSGNPAVEVKRLREELRKADLHNKLLNAMIDIAEEQFGIPIRKKHGAGR